MQCVPESGGLFMILEEATAASVGDVVKHDKARSKSRAGGKCVKLGSLGEGGVRNLMGVSAVFDGFGPARRGNRT